MKIAVLGASGMLGNYLTNYLETKFQVIPIGRADIDAANAGAESILKLLEQKGLQKDDIVVNAIGTIKPRVDELGDLNAILVNSVFPHYLANVAESLQLKMVHITTDCVFSGDRGQYNEKDKHDVTDVYGRTKSLGEPTNCSVFRTSIIGEEKNSKRSLVEWIKSNAGAQVNGFTNHLWNGLTCLQVAKSIEKMANENIFWKGVRHVHSPSPVNKLELVQLVSDVYELNLKVNPKETDQKCDRSLSTLYPTFDIPELKVQVTEMKKFRLK